ncbi:preprotein translocase subunit YajC [Rhodoligotrophos appendicifer]|uniref:preprotein translocase subunit YajC n=1 Tax=Rhodoligotrophos appendicifer TaxID=987056 RepID=UPI001185B8D5|nr:preprotein translocase subunit YajC [Rhodoligotrophos appendicifer]
MFITPAYAQGIAAPSSDFLVSMLPLVAIFVIFYFLLIRPQQRRAKQHQEMVTNIRRGDTIVTTGGLIGKVSKVIDEREIQVEIAENVRVRVVKSMVGEVRVKGEPAKDESPST